MNNATRTTTELEQQLGDLRRKIEAAIADNDAVDIADLEVASELVAELDRRYASEERDLAAAIRRFDQVIHSLDGIGGAAGGA